MSKVFTAGRMELSVSEPWPIWCDLRVNEVTIRIDHRDLADLRHVVKRAIKEARRRLTPGNALEV